MSLKPKLFTPNRSKHLTCTWTYAHALTSCGSLPQPCMPMPWCWHIIPLIACKDTQAMKYYVWHTFGILNDYNTFTHHPWHSAGQGAANAALCYIVLLDTLSNAYHTKIAPNCMHNPTYLIPVLCSLKAIIDNVVLHASGTQHQPIEKLCNNAMTQLQWWNKLVQVTGGALNPKKCCTIAYTWQPDKCGILQLAKMTPTSAPITFLNAGQHTQLLIWLMDEGICYLSIYFTGDHNTHPMEQHIWQKAQLYTVVFQWTPMTHWEAGSLYQSCFVPTLAYPLPATWLPDHFFDHIHCLLMSTVLNKMGCHRNLPWCMVFVPCAMGGIGLCHLQHKMEVKQILILLQHMKAHTPLRQALVVLTWTYQIWDGIS